MSLNKEARGHSADPEQEKLREAKDAWNHEVSLLIAELIAFKRGVNGRGDKNLGIPPSSIKDPLPNQVSSYLGTIANQSGKVQEVARSIIDYQTHYSQVRKKKQSEASAEYPLISEGSWWGSRLWSYVALLRKVEKVERKFRHRIISSLAEYKHDFLKTENTILARKDPDSIPDTLTLLINIFFDMQMNLLAPFAELDKIHQAKTAVQEKMPTENGQGSEGTGESSSLPETPGKQEVSVVDEILITNGLLLAAKPYLDIVVKFLQGSDKLNDDNKLLLQKQFQLFNKAVVGINNLNYQKGTSEVDKTKLEARFKILLASFDYLKGIIGQVFPTVISVSIKDFAMAVEQIAKSLTTTANFSVGLIKESDNALSRWFNKSLLSFRPNNFDKIKLDLLQRVENIKELSEELSDSLEDPDATYLILQDKLSYLCQEVIASSNIMINLSEKYQNDIQQERKLKGEKFRNIRAEDLRRLNKIINIFKPFVI